MTANEKLALAKSRLDLTAATYDTLLNGYILDAGYFITSVTGQATIPAALEGLQVDIAVEHYSKRGAEGESSHSEGGVSMTFESLSPAAQALLRSQSYARVVNMLEEP